VLAVLVTGFGTESKWWQSESGSGSDCHLFLLEDHAHVIEVFYSSIGEGILCKWK